MYFQRILSLIARFSLNCWEIGDKRSHVICKWILSDIFHIHTIPRFFRSLCTKIHLSFYSYLFIEKNRNKNKVHCYWKSISYYNKSDPSYKHKSRWIILIHSCFKIIKIMVYFFITYDNFIKKGRFNMLGNIILYDL